MVDLWQAVESGPKPPDTIFIVIEMNRGSQNKYEYDKKLKSFKLDRVLYTFIPCDYGFIPRTLDDDGDPLDALLLINQPTFTGCVVTARPIGIMIMEDEGKRDDKILAVSTTDPHFRHFKNLADIPKPMISEITYFFEHYKEPEGKKTKVVGWKDVNQAKRLIEKTINEYRAKLK